MEKISEQMSNQGRLLYAGLGSLGITLAAIALGYLWGRVVHYPFTLLQRKVWTYYVLCSCSFPILVPLMVAMGIWLLPLQDTVETAIALLLAWMILALYIIRRMSKPGGRLSKERLGPN